MNTAQHQREMVAGAACIASSSMFLGYLSVRRGPHIPMKHMIQMLVAGMVLAALSYYAGRKLIKN